MDFSKDYSLNTQTWNESFSLNIPVIDKQHKKFFAMYDELTLLNNDEKNETEILPLLNEMIRYAIYHFNTEEELMRQADSPEQELHMRQHELFRKRCDDFQIAFNYKNRVLVNQMVGFMRKWMVTHINGVDAKYAASIKKLLENES